jgi:hypothetical protein
MMVTRTEVIADWVEEMSGITFNDDNDSFSPSPDEMGYQHVLL